VFLQLSNNRTIELSLEQYLDLTDEDIQYLISCGNEYTFDTINPFHKKFSYQSKEDKIKQNEYLDYDELDDLDY